MTSTQRFGRTCSVFVRGACGPDLHHREGSAGWLSVTVGMPYPQTVHLTFHPEEMTIIRRALTGWNSVERLQMKLGAEVFAWESPSFAFIIQEVMQYGLHREEHWVLVREIQAKWADDVKYFHVTLTHQQREELLVWLDMMREQGLAA